MRLLRRIHLYLGCLFAPLLIFFVGTGWYQTVNHDRLKSPSEAETWVQKLRVVHTDQIYPGDRELSRPSSPRLFQWLVGAMSVALLGTTVLGVVLALRVVRPLGGVVFVLVAGIVLPILLLWLGRAGLS
jgi:hypothetical protein